MKTTIFIMTIFAAAMLHADDSPLVKAAKANGGPKKPMPKKVITNADVKKSKGTLVVLPPKQPDATVAAVEIKGPLAKQDDEFHAREAADASLAKAQKKVDDLQKELRRIEDAYYAENDPNYRDSTIVPRFNQTKNQLEIARKELADARDGQNKLKE